MRCVTIRASPPSLASSIPTNRPWRKSARPATINAERAEPAEFFAKNALRVPRVLRCTSGSSIACWCECGARKRPRRHVAGGQTERPLDCLEVHLRDVAVVPGLGGMAERRIEHRSPAVRLRPCKREIAVGPPVVRVGRHLRRVEAEQDAELVAGERLR